MGMRCVVVPVFAILFGTTTLLCNATAATVYVSKNALDNVHDGQSWQTAFLTVQDGINAANMGDDVWVAYGTYVENIVMREGIALYGGFYDNAVSFSQRNPKVFVTILDGNQSGSVVRILYSRSLSTRVDGFTIRNGTGFDVYGNQMYFGGGILCVQSDLIIANNIIVGNSAPHGGGGICLLAYSSPKILANDVRSNSAGNGGGIYCDVGCNPMISNNFLVGNAGIGGGIYSYYSGAPTIVNNTIHGTGWGDGIYSVSYTSTVFANNIIAYCDVGIVSSYSVPVFIHNNVYGNRYDYMNVSPGPTDISIEPMFVDNTAGDYHLRVGSPCVDAGDNAAVLDNTWTDIDGELRIQKGYDTSPFAIVDIGADELDTVSPTTFIDITGTLGENGWYITNVTATLTALDDGTGVARTEYTLDGINWMTYTEPIVVSFEGQSLIGYRSVDNAGNVEEIQQQIIRIDTTLPTWVSNDPVDNSTNVPRDKTITVTFSEDVQAAVYFPQVTLKKGSTVIAVTKSITGNRLVIDPVSALGKTSTYVVTVPASSIKDMAGHNLEIPASFSFTTSK